jgi:hypothetical protein
MCCLLIYYCFVFLLSSNLDDTELNILVPLLERMSNEDITSVPDFLGG